jgi:periplasmic protein TonB
MKSNILVLTTLLLAANSWSQETPERALTMPVESVPHSDDSNRVYQVAEEEAEFPGGRGELLKFISSSIQYPESALKNKLEGKCYVQFIVESDGSITNQKIARGVPDCTECDAEALRVVSTMPKWKPGKMGGKPVRTLFYVPVVFKL